MLTVPPLRERSSDIELLVHHFAEKFTQKNRRQLDKITRQCLQYLKAYSWPGNVRELENAIERGVILMRGCELTEKSLPLAIQKNGEAGGSEHSLEPTSLFEAEKRLVMKTLTETEGNKSEAARRLGVTRKTLQNKLNRYNE